MHRRGAGLCPALEERGTADVVSDTVDCALAGAGEGPVGAKWDWGRFDAFELYVRRLEGGSTFYELVWCQVEEERGKRSWRPWTAS